MTDIYQKEKALLNEVRSEFPHADGYAVCRIALRRAIQQHEATKQEFSDYKQKVSDIVSAYVHATSEDDWEKLKTLIIPAPKPDPLVEAMADCGVDRFESWADQLRAALDARGLEIREKNDDQ